MHTKEQEEETPTCSVCGHHIGFMVDVVLMLKGQMFWNTNDQCPALVLEPTTEYAELEAKTHTGLQKMLILNPANMGEMRIVHAECYDQEIAFLSGEDEEEELSEEDFEDLDSEMDGALERDGHSHAHGEH